MMRVITSPFFYSKTIALDQDSYLIDVPVGISHEAELFSQFRRAAVFPTWFGNNWDALLDCLRDLSWIRTRKIIIRHEDLPLSDSPPECRTYIQMLASAASTWMEPPRTGDLEIQGWTYVEHDLLIVFPMNVKDAVETIWARGDQELN
jgi:hypothetical protein